MLEDHKTLRRCNCAKIVIFIAAIISFNAFADGKKTLNDYSPVFDQGAYAMHANFDACKINLNLYKGDRLWFDGGWAAFFDQGKSKKIKATDSHVIQSNISWSIKPPALHEKYWLWVACDPPADPIGISLPDRKNVCEETAKNSNVEGEDDNKFPLLSKGKWKGSLVINRSRKSKETISFGFCFFDKTHEIVGGGEIFQKEKNLSKLLDILNSIAIEN